MAQEAPQDRTERTLIESTALERVRQLANEKNLRVRELAHAGDEYDGPTERLVFDKALGKFVTEPVPLSPSGKPVVEFGKVWIELRGNTDNDPASFLRTQVNERTLFPPIELDEMNKDPHMHSATLERQKPLGNRRPLWFF